MPKYIRKKALKNAIDCCTWYHINKNGELVEGAGVEDEPLYKYSDIKKIIKGLPTRKFKDEPQISGVVWTDNEMPIYHSTTASADEPQTCDTCRFDDRYGNESICKECARHYSDNYAPIEDESQTDCPWK